MENSIVEAEKIKAEVRQRYAQIAESSEPTSCCGMEETKPSSSCCGSENTKTPASCSEPAETKAESSCCGGENHKPGFTYSFIGEDYQKLPGYQPEADLGLGCGLPTELAQIKEGDTVVDLGSGAGNDVFVARRIVGEKGKVIGVDMTPEMVAKAKENNSKLGFKNIEFVLGEIESLPLPDQTADVVVSNCVLNLVPDKQKAFREICRVLKPGGHFNVSDIVLNGSLPEKLRKEAELYAGCVAGAVKREQYLGFIQQAGFVNVKVQKDRRVEVPEPVLLKYLSELELKVMMESGMGIFSITVWGEKP